VPGSVFLFKSTLGSHPLASTLVFLVSTSQWAAALVVIATAISCTKMVISECRLRVALFF
jgi:hypothetical protein